MKVERKGVEPSTSALRTQPDTVISDIVKGLTATPATVCTKVCTSDIWTHPSSEVSRQILDPIIAIAILISTLNDADRERLANLLAELLKNPPMAPNAFGVRDQTGRSNGRE